MNNTTASTPSEDVLAFLQRRLERHFLTCTAALGAAAVLAPAQEANADIVYHPVNVQIPLNTAAGIYFNLETGAFGNSAGAVPGWDLNIFNPNSFYLSTYAPATTGLIGYTSGTYNYADRLANGATISNAANFLFGGLTTMSFTGSPPAGAWLGNVSGFLGVQFQLADSSTVFGWVSVEVTNSVNARVTGFAYETSGGAIAAGAIPEPSTLALSFFAAGAAGVGYWRRRRKAAQAA